MGIYDLLKNAVRNVIRQNGNQEITGSVMQNTLVTIIEGLATGSMYKGVATPTTNPGTPDANVFYLTSTNGTYQYFNNIVVNDELAVLTNAGGSWSKQSVPMLTQASLDNARNTNVIWFQTDYSYDPTSQSEVQIIPAYSINQPIKGMQIVGALGIHSIMSASSASRNWMVIEASTLVMRTGYYPCTTPSTTANKTIDTDAIYPEMMNGGCIKVKMSYSNLASDVTFAINYRNVQSKIMQGEAKPLYFRGEPVSGSNTWKDGETIEIYYDGSVYQAISHEMPEQVTYTESNTGASTATKTANLKNYRHIVGDTFKVRFTYANTATNAILRINNQFQEQIYYNDAPTSPSNTWQANEIVEFMYNGHAFVAKKWL